MDTLIRHCLVCECTEQQVPLVQLQYQDNAYWTYPQHLPVLIHSPEQLAGKLPGAENLAPHEHDAEK